MNEIVKETLVLIPGFLCDETVWKSQVEVLEPYAEIVIPSFSGKYSLKGMAQQILDHAPQQFSLVGHSLGGRIAFEIIHLAPQRINKMAVMDTGVHPVLSGELEKRQKILEIAQQQGMEAFAQQWVPPMISRAHHHDKALVQALHDMTIRFSVEDCENQINASLSREDQSKYLPHINKNILLICGDEDTWSPVDQHLEMQASLLHSDLRIIKDCGHMTTMEKPQQVNQILLDWFCE